MTTAREIPSEQAALLAAIIANPDEDTPRLVYADWLQENGDEKQAQFIRDCVSMDWLTDYEDDKRERIAKRINHTADHHGSRWLEEIGVVGADPAYDRGMVDGVVYSRFHTFLADAPALFAREPVRELAIQGLGAYEETDSPDALVQLAAMPELGRLRTLHLSNRGWPVPSEGWEQFITSPHLVQLQILSVQAAGLTDENMLMFNQCSHLANLEVLDLGGNNLTATGALTVLRSAHLQNLTRFRLAGNTIVEDRRRGSAFLALRAALIERFDHASGLYE